MTEPGSRAADTPPGGQEELPGGEAACALHRVCDACGALEDGPPAPVCPRCGDLRAG